MLRRLLLALLLAIAPLSAGAEPWPEIESRARGQTVYWNAWGGDQPTNDFIAWTAAEAEARYGVLLRHVKLADTADAVARVLAEKVAGRTSGGSVDLIWINGENFAAMKEQDLLYGPFAQSLPNHALLDLADKPLLAMDFGVPTAGLESPWGMAQFVFYRDSMRLPRPPRSMTALLRWAQGTPGRFAYPQPPDFTGTTFLKQALHDLLEDPSPLWSPVTDADFAAVTAPLWVFLDALHPVLWRGGRTFPAGAADLERLLADGELELAVSFNPMVAATGIAAGRLPSTTRVHTLDHGTIANANFVAIPFNANAREGAMVMANFLLSPEAQAKHQDPRFGGIFSVLDPARLEPADRALFDAVPRHPAAPDPAELGRPIAEPHPSWTPAIEAEWQRRYGRG